jgi:hypothetical protein
MPSTFQPPTQARTLEFDDQIPLARAPDCLGNQFGYMAAHVKTGWVPRDEGMLGQSAERALHGELPHRNSDVSTKELTFVYASAFREFKINSASMCLVLFAFLGSVSHLSQVMDSN